MTFQYVLVTCAAATGTTRLCRSAFDAASRKLAITASARYARLSHQLKASCRRRSASPDTAKPSNEMVEPAPSVDDGQGKEENIVE